MTLFDAIRDRLATDEIEVLGEIQRTPARPYYLVTVRPGPPEDRRLSHDAGQLPATAWVMAVNNSPAGCTFLTERAIALLDNYLLTPHGPATVTLTGPVIDDEGPGDYRWSQGVEVRVTSPKESP